VLVDHCWGNTPTGKFLRLNIEDIVLQSGLYGPLWDQNYNMYASWCQTDTWIFQVCKFYADHHITIDVAHACLLIYYGCGGAIVGQPVGYHPGISREEWLAEQMELLAVESSQCKVYTQERI
jgi:hypothetical protein